jgi:WhiB family transcriptional regulator, redox-sensing transcriptional regulator
MTFDASKGLCLDADPEVFFGDKVWDIEAAKNICRKCPIMEDCLEVALRDNVKYGVWGGATPEERTLFKREPRKKLHHIYIAMGKDINDVSEEYV